MKLKTQDITPKAIRELYESQQGLLIDNKVADEIVAFVDRAIRELNNLTL